jgi:hypothetical protein
LGENASAPVAIVMDGCVAVAGTQATAPVPPELDPAPPLEPTPELPVPELEPNPPPELEELEPEPLNPPELELELLEPPLKPPELELPFEPELDCAPLDEEPPPPPPPSSKPGLDVLEQAPSAAMEQAAAASRVRGTLENDADIDGLLFH